MIPGAWANPQSQTLTRKILETFGAVNIIPELVRFFGKFQEGGPWSPEAIQRWTIVVHPEKRSG